MGLAARLQSRLRDLPLLRKFNLFICTSLFIALLGSAAGIRLIYNSGNRMLYDAMRGSMSYSASIISEKLMNTHALTEIILSDGTIQEMLSITANADASNAERANAFASLTFAIPEYYQNYRQNGLYYIALYTENYTVYSDVSRSRKLPDYVEDTVLQAAHNAPGYGIWTTDYCNTYGLFISRDIRRAKGLKLDTIGTILINVDIQAVIRDACAGLWPDDTPLYIIQQDGAEIYRSAALPASDSETLEAAAQNEYGVLRLNGSSFFYARGVIPELGWQYLCLTPNDSVAGAQRLSLALVCVILGGALVISFVLTGRLFASVTQHLQCLLGKMRYFSRNNAVPMETAYDYARRRDEIGVLHQGFDQMANQVQELIQKNYVNELLTREAQLKALENQINPHFLYNTLESINWRAKAIDAADISTMVEALGALLHTTLSRKFGDSTLRSELEIVENYMAIIKMRFDDGVEYGEAVPSELDGLAMPKLTLQPLVENAIHYALEETGGSVLIRISAAAAADRAVIQISNSGSQFPDDLLDKLEREEVAPHGFGIGLRNIHRRIRLQFGPEYGLSLRNDVMNDLAIVRITLPWNGGKKTEDG